jgi:hypothetical protein
MAEDDTTTNGSRKRPRSDADDIAASDVKKTKDTTSGMVDRAAQSYHFILT